MLEYLRWLLSPSFAVYLLTQACALGEDSDDGEDAAEDAPLAA